jgi:IS605 OrfB family transposase
MNEWDSISALSIKETVTVVERFIHGTKQNPSPLYGDFDSAFYKFPSYFRRAAIAEGFGIVKSYQSNLKNHCDKAQGLIFKDQPPQLQRDHYAFSVFYKENMSKNRTQDTIELKVFKDNDWKWITVSYKGKVLEHRSIRDYKICNPSLVKRRKMFALHFPFEKKITLNKTKLKDQVVVAVDLGLTKSAVCSAMDAKGTVTDRLFIDQPVEKDRMQTKLNKLKQVQRLSGLKNRYPNHWRKINNYQKQIVQDTVNQIVDFAVKNDADVIVFEYLGKIKGGKIKQRLHHWAKDRIQEKVEHKAHREGIRVRRVSARNTSKLAFDGSGVVKRNNKKDLCTFTGGKVYHSDLNASYNIGARYYIREKLKPLSAKKRLFLEAKVPSLAKRTSCTLDSLISLNKAI